MFKKIGTGLLILALCNLALAQQESVNVSPPSPIPLVTAGASPERVRFAAPNTVVQMRLQVYTNSAQLLFDASSKGNVLDWTLQNSSGERLSAGAYLCVVTIKSLDGKLRQRIGEVSVQEQRTQLRAIDSSHLTLAQQQEVGPMEKDSFIAVTTDNETEATTILAHNGEEGQITRGRGALSFRIGDFYGGTDQEQMRLTAEGNLGIGIAQPQARLDVDGFVRASQGIVFPDGSVQFSASRKTFGPPSQRPGEFRQKGTAGQEHLLPDIGGTGTTGKIAKWIDGPNGILGDSLITEANNNIGINTTPDPRFKLDVLGFNRFFGPNVSFYLSGFKPGGNDWVFQTVDDDGRFRLWGGTTTTGAERLTIKLDTGNVGIGNGAPTFKLHVVDTGSAGLRVQTNVSGGTLASFGGFGDFLIDAVNIPGGRLTVQQAGNVGLGTATPQAKLDVRGDVKLGSSGQYFATSGEENLRIVRGTVDLNGNILSGSGFQVSHPDTGIYGITFDTPFASTPSVMATIDGNGARWSIFTQTTGTSRFGFGINTYEPGQTGSFHSFGFNFIAVGPR